MVDSYCPQVTNLLLYPDFERNFDMFEPLRSMQVRLGHAGVCLCMGVCVACVCVCVCCMGVHVATWTCSSRCAACRCAWGMPVCAWILV